MPDTPLGTRMYSRGMVLHGTMTVPRWKHFLTEAASALGMEAVGEPATWHYPTINGAGGSGATIFQAITESFIVVDTWPDHDGAYIFIASCKPFDPANLRETIRLFGLEPSEMTSGDVLRLR